MFLRCGLEIILEITVMQLHCAHGLGDERMVVLIGASLNESDFEGRVIFFKTRGQNTASEATTHDQVVRHDSCRTGNMRGSESTLEESFRAQMMRIRNKKG